jgi:hypothetical protein
MTTTTHSHKRWTDKGGHVIKTAEKLIAQGRTVVELRASLEPQSTISIYLTKSIEELVAP